MRAEALPTRYRTLFLSDLHLGARGCQVDHLLNFLASLDAETIYLVGDIIDGWRLDHRWYWPQSHSDVLSLLMAKGRTGTRLVYLPGNHDEFLRPYCGTRTGEMEFANQAIHEAANGKRYLVLHGDCFDRIQQDARWLAFVGDYAYVAALALNTAVNRVGRGLGLPYWSFSNWAKKRVKGAVNFIGRYEEVLARTAREHAVDGVVCGHIHSATIHEDFGLTYVNCGDWVESCTAIVEHDDGQMEIIEWANLRAPEVLRPQVESEGAVA